MPKTLGQHAELLALQYLQSKGLTLIEKNFCCKLGEIDLIMKEKNCLVFIEVRLRHASSYQDSLSSVNTTKQHRLIRTAQFYLKMRNYNFNATECRFDVIGLSSLNRNDEILWIHSAFDAEYGN